jgi:hypothetical protein
MSTPPTSIAAAILGLIVFGAFGIAATLWPRVIQRYASRKIEPATETLALRAVGAFMLALAAVMAYVTVPILAVGVTAAGGAVYLLWPRAVRRYSTKHVESRLFVWEVRVGGVVSLMAATAIAYFLLARL